MEARHFPAFIVISILYLTNMLLAYIGYRRMLRLRPVDVSWSVVAYSVGSTGTALMLCGLFGGSMAFGLASSIGGILLMIGLVFGLQLCFMRIDTDPPNDPPSVDEPDDPPVLRQPWPSSPRHRLRRHAYGRRSHREQPIVLLR